jgi:outer membrane immunogenic protein
MQKSLAVIGLGLLLATSAQAADMARPVYKAAPVMAPVVYNWSGFYIGGHVGWAGSTDRVNGNDGTFDNLGAQSFTLKPNDWMAGGQIGFNWQASNWVLGVEADLGKFGLSKSAFFTGPGAAVPLDDFFSVKYDTYYTVTGRIGYAFDRALWYAKGGYVNSKITTVAGDFDAGVIDPTDSVTVSKRRGGWTIGGGLEYGLTENWSIKGEYLYMKFDNVSVQNLDGLPAQIYTFDDKVHTVKFGINYRFGYGKTPVMAKY